MAPTSVPRRGIAAENTVTSQRILVVEDDESMQEIISYALAQSGFEAITVKGVAEAEQAVREKEPDLLILDIQLPDGSGFEFCKSIRSESGLPIIIVSARTEELDRILGLELGADDYVTKPFSPRELVSRVKAQLRRTTEPQRRQKVLVSGPLKVDIETHQAFMNDTLLNLTNSEFQILALLARNPGKVFSRAAILNYLWGGGFVGDERTVDVHVHNLREKIEPEAQKPTYLQTVRGLGYRLADT